MFGTRKQKILGTSSDSAAIRRFVEEAAACSSPILLLGEPGVGKELIARQIHGQSKEQDKPFLSIDCSLYYEKELFREIFGYGDPSSLGKHHQGALEFATDGICYLSRIEELTLELQEELAGFLRSRMFSRLGDGKEIVSNARLVVSTIKDLSAFVNAGLFSADLFSLLGDLRFYVTPLRARKEDIEVIVRFLIEEYGHEKGLAEPANIAPNALAALMAFPWPRNVDELIEEVQRAFERGRAHIVEQCLSFEVSSYWRGRRGDTEVARVVDEIESYIQEFKILSRLDAEFGEILIQLEDDDLYVDRSMSGVEVDWDCGYES